MGDLTRTRNRNRGILRSLSLSSVSASSSLCFDESLTLETSGSLTRYGGQFAAVSNKDWELPNSRISLARPASRPVILLQ